MPPATRQFADMDNWRTVLGTRRLATRRERRRPDLCEPGPARTRADPAVADAPGSAPPRRAVLASCSPHPTREPRRTRRSPPRRCSTSPPTTSTPTRSAGCAILSSHTGGLIVISHDVELLADVVNRVWFLDAVRGEADVYNMGWVPRRPRHRRATSPPGTRQRRTQRPPHCAPRRPRWAPRPPKPLRAEHVAPRR